MFRTSLSKFSVAAISSAAVAGSLLTVVPAASAAPVTATASASASVSTADRNTRPNRSAVRTAAIYASVNSNARSLAGVPYVRGGTTPRGFDCSGYTQYVYRKAGVKLPRVASAQRAATVRVSRSNARPGDLVFFHRGGSTYHVGIYAGGNKVWHAPYPGKRVQKANIWTRNVSFGRAKTLA